MKQIIILLMAIAVVPMTMRAQTQNSCDTATVNGQFYPERQIDSGMDAVKEDTTVYRVVDVMPEFPGGDVAFKRYVAINVKYPKEAIQKSIQGVVVVSFVVDETGHVTDAKVVESVHKILDKEALIVVRDMPRWSPGEHNGKAVKVFLTIPVGFRLGPVKTEIKSVRRVGPR